MPSQDTPLAHVASDKPSPRRRLSVRAAALTIALLSGALWTGVFWLLGQGL